LSACKGAAETKVDAELPPVSRPSDVDDAHAELVPTAIARDVVIVEADDPSKGAAEPLVVIVEWSDFQCPYCGRFANALDELVAAYPDDVRIVFKQFPLPMHPDAELGARATLAAHAQGKFWAMHDRLFENARDLTDENFARWASELGLEAARFERDRNDPKTAERISAQAQQCMSLGARGTPSFFINGRYLSGAQPIESFRTLIDEEAKKADAMLRKGVKPKKLYDAIIKGGKTAP
jgi:protein-disulfide isomerase